MLLAQQILVFVNPHTNEGGRLGSIINHSAFMSFVWALVITLVHVVALTTSYINLSRQAIPTIQAPLIEAAVYLMILPTICTLSGTLPLKLGGWVSSLHIAAALFLFSGALWLRHASIFKYLAWPAILERIAWGGFCITGVL